MFYLIPHINTHTMNDRRWEYDSMSFGAAMTRVWVALYSLHTCIIGGAWWCGVALLLREDGRRFWDVYTGVMAEQIGVPSLCQESVHCLAGCAIYKETMWIAHGRSDLCRP